MAMVNFYGLWDTVETAFLGRQQSMVDGERYLRVLVLQSTGPQGLLLGSEALGELIADYIATFDAALKFYFSAPEPQSPAVRQQVERLYREYYERRNTPVHPLTPHCDAPLISPARNPPQKAPKPTTPPSSWPESVRISRSGRSTCCCACWSKRRGSSRS